MYIVTNYDLMCSHTPPPDKLIITACSTEWPFDEREGGGGDVILKVLDFLLSPSK